MELWDQLIQKAAERIESYLTARLESLFTKLFRSNLKVILTEAEAAKELGVCLQTLQGWRKQGIIDYCSYPPARVKDGPGRTAVYTYDMADILNFRERYKSYSFGSRRFEMSKNISVLGPVIEEKSNVRRIG